MKKQGFLPFTTIGLILLLLSASLAVYFQWDDHQNTMNLVDKSSASTISTKVSGKRNDLKRQTREVLYNALWRVGKNAEDYSGSENREKHVENIASRLLGDRLSSLEEKQKVRSFITRTNLNIKPPKFEIERGENGYVIADIYLPKGSSISESLPDNSVSIILPCENLRTWSDVRFFLLQDRMNEFGRELNKIERRWKYAEYVSAYAQIWGKNEINLNKDRSRALFQLSLSSHEIQKFGSTDYYAIALDLLDCFNPISDNYNSSRIIDPIKENKIEKLKLKIKDAFSDIRKSRNNLESLIPSIKKTIQFKPEKHLQEELNAIFELKKISKTAERDYLQKKFQKICQEFSDTYSLPTKQIDKVLHKMRKSEKLAKKSRKNFLSGLEILKKSSENNPLLKQLYEDFTQKENPRGIALQIKGGVKNVIENFEYIEKRIKKSEINTYSYDNISQIFPRDLQKRLKEALKEDNRELVNKILKDAYISAENAIRHLKDHPSRDKMKKIFRKTLEEIKIQIKEPEPNWRKNYRNYPEPGQSPSKEPEEKTIEKYVIPPQKGTIGGIAKILKKTKSNLGNLGEIDKKIDKKKKKLEKFEIDKSIKRYIGEEPSFSNLSGISREKCYEIVPPIPLKLDPGITVYHELNIKEVSYDREDPLGLVHESAPPTPIYLWFIDTIIYWSMWNVKIKFGKPLTEEIFDYKNQTIPKPITDDSKTYIHKPLPYKREFQKSEFSFRLLAFSLRNFAISYE
ncbi:hypothetical protein AKJ62_00395 [candidate division MSBL1 archaeon SCGC-AAA259D14]|uniref:Uncharacterized protein n=3 Tax=candidate division MSBL1 TaxID=215777 RepID=A0A133U8R0_9EURY|nr:hypothetical protein AKJ62_00395 [candidate division MSBL1 archaeon SCGC-AAA259D14]KXA92731.1 hypothetical protein AKJ66_03625 [candidate division MSBL1 archaeon SCGC-AAA259E22]